MADAAYDGYGRGARAITLANLNSALSTNGTKDMNDDLASTFDVLQFFRAGWKRTVVGGLIGVTLGTTFAFITPKWYKAELSVVPTTTAKGGGAMLSGAAAVLGMSDLPFDLGGGADADRIDAMFHSNSVADRVITKFNLMTRYKAKYLEDAREVLWKNCSTKIDKKASVLTLSCEDKVPATATTMVTFMAEAANEVAHRTSTSSASEERRFLEKRVAKAKEDLDQASRRLREFQEHNKVISLPEQASAVVGSMASLRAQILDKQMQLAFTDSFASSEESTSDQLRRQVGILERKLKSLQESKTTGDTPAPEPSAAAKRLPIDNSTASGLFPAAMTIPKLQFELGDLMREQKIQETLFALLTERYEFARINEARDTSTFQVLDSPIVPTKKSRPKRMVIAAIAGVLGAFVGVVLTMLSVLRAAASSSNPSKQN